MKGAILFGELLVLLFPSALTDLKRKVVCPVWSLIAGTALTFLNLVLDLVSLKEMIPGFLVGLLFFLPPLLWPGSLGVGDSILIAFTGAVSGIGRLAALLLLSFPTAAGTGLLILKTRDRGDGEIYLPFIPFLFGAALLLLILSLIFPPGSA